MNLYQHLQEKLREIPGVKSASISTYSPMSGYQWDDEVYVEGGQWSGAAAQRLLNPTRPDPWLGPNPLPVSVTCIPGDNTVGETLLRMAACENA